MAIEIDKAKLVNIIEAHYDWKVPRTYCEAALHVAFSVMLTHAANDSTKDILRAVVKGTRNEVISTILSDIESNLETIYKNSMHTSIDLLKLMREYMAIQDSLAESVLQKAIELIVQSCNEQRRAVCHEQPPHVH